ncbi:MAG: M43 family zinc metalloprotease [Flavobacteriales bacterium]|nr:MAG: M43 family zinc metalloprotease [Flavobacteriales bacterium]
MKRSLLASLTLFALAAPAMAQQPLRCGTDERRAWEIANDPTYLQREAAFEEELRQLMASAATQRDGDEVYVIPVVFHILHLGGRENISNEQILDAMEILNRDYAKLNDDTATVHPSFQERIADMRIQFALATKDPAGNCTNGIVRHRSTETFRGESTSKLKPWPREKYMNVWVVNGILSGAAGYFTYGPWSVLDGIMLLHNYLGSIGTSAEFSSRALTHEVGHYLSLAHIWGSNNGVPDPNTPIWAMQSDCGDDGVEDTPLTRGWSACQSSTNASRPWADCDRQRFRTPVGDSYVDGILHNFDGVTTSSGTTAPGGPIVVVDSITFTTPRAQGNAATAVGVSANSSQSGRFAFVNWDGGATDGETDYANLSGSINTGKYYQFSVAPEVTHQATILGISFKASRNDQGPRTFAVRASTNNYGSNLTIAGNGFTVQGTNVGFLPDNTDEATVQVTVPTSGFINLEGPVTFRIYGWNSEDGTGAFVVDDVNIAGRSATIENVENYMEYSYCSKMFTPGQRDRARAALNSPTYQRDLLWTESNLQATGVAEGFQQTCAPIADFYAQVDFAGGGPSIPYTPMTCTGQNVRFMDNSQRAFPTSWSWTFQDGNPATSDQRNPIVQFNSRGWKTVTLTVANDQGSDSKTNEFAVYVGESSQETGPFFESFETQQGENLFPFVSANHENNFSSFSRHVGGGYSGNACARLNSGDRNPLDLLRPDNIGDYDELVSPHINMSNAPFATLSFRYAYSSNTNVVDNITERLVVQYSNTCGRTWNDFPNNTITGTALVTNGNNTGEAPAQDGWKLKTFNLSSSMTGPNMRFRWRFISSGYSNDLYIDDINFGSWVGMDEVTRASFIAVFPNPANDHFTLQVAGMSTEATEITITDMRGAVVYQNKFQPMGGANIEIGGRTIGLAEGMYLVRASNSLGSSVQKLVMER